MAAVVQYVLPRNFLKQLAHDLLSNNHLRNYTKTNTRLRLSVYSPSLGLITVKYFPLSRSSSLQIALGIWLDAYLWREKHSFQISGPTILHHRLRSPHTNACLKIKRKWQIFLSRYSETQAILLPLRKPKKLCHFKAVSHERNKHEPKVETKHKTKQVFPKDNAGNHKHAK